MSEIPQTTEQTQTAKNNRLIIILKAIGIFLRGFADSLTKLAVSAGVLGVYMQMPDKVPAWVPVATITGVFAVSLFRFIYIKTGFITIDLRNSDKDNKENQTVEEPQKKESSDGN